MPKMLVQIFAGDTPHSVHNSFHHFTVPSTAGPTKIRDCNLKTFNPEHEMSEHTP